MTATLPFPEEPVRTSARIGSSPFLLRAQRRATRRGASRRRRLRSRSPFDPTPASPLRVRLAACAAPPGPSLAPPTGTASGAGRRLAVPRMASPARARRYAASLPPIAIVPSVPPWVPRFAAWRWRAFAVRAPSPSRDVRRFGPVLRTVVECSRPLSMAKDECVGYGSPSRAWRFAPSLPAPASFPPASCRAWRSVATLRLRPRSTLPATPFHAASRCAATRLWSAPCPAAVAPARTPATGRSRPHDPASVEWPTPDHCPLLPPRCPPH